MRMHVYRTGFLSDRQRRIWLLTTVDVAAKCDEVVDVKLENATVMENVVYDRSNFDRDAELDR